MRISAKGRYALAALIEIAAQAGSGEPVPVGSIAGSLGISKLFLEQIAAGLKKGGLIYAVKGSKGGYQLTREAEKITALDALRAVENMLFESSEADVFEQAPAVSNALSALVFIPLDKAVEECLAGVTLRALLDFARDQGDAQSFMLYL